MSLDTMKQNIGQTKGLYQGIDENLLSMSYSPDCQNISVKDGIISTHKGSSILTDISLDGAGPGATGLPYACRKIIPVPVYDESTALTAQNFTYMYVFGTVDGSNYHWYYYGWTGSEFDWIALGDLNGVNPEQCDFVQYLIEDEPYIFLFSDDGDYTINGSLGGSGYWGITTAALTTDPPTGKYCMLHQERIWVVSDRNTVTYCNQYDPEDWSTAGEAGDINIVTHDADSITGIDNWLDDPLIFKRNSIWKISGDEPSEYSLSQVYSTRGAIYGDSIVTNGDSCFFASTDGIYSYDGTTCEPLLTKEIKDIFSGMQHVKCTIYEDKLYVWDIYQGSGYVGKHIVYDIVNKTIDVLYVGTVYEAYGKMYSVGTSVYELNDTTLTLSGAVISAYWFTPESNAAYPNADKTLIELAFTAWGTNSAGAAGGQMKVTIYYNRNGTQRTKEITVTMATTRKQHKYSLNKVGDLFKFKIENVSGSAINLTGFEAKYEIDEE